MKDASIKSGAKAAALYLLSFTVWFILAVTLFGCTVKHTESFTVEMIGDE